MAYDGDLDALIGFIDESNDSLQGIEADFVALENDPGNVEIINRIFRPVHSLKGNSGFFGLTNINKFSHRLENLLDSTRKGELIINKEIIDVLLRGVEYLQAMLDRAQGDPGDVGLREEEKAFLQVVESFQPAYAIGSIQSVITLEKLLQEFLDLGLNVHETPFVTALLDQIEKTNIEIENLMEAKRNVGPPNVYSPDNAYFLDDRDFSEAIHCLGTVAEHLQERKTLARELQQCFAKAVAEVSEALKGRESVATALDELAAMSNFLDDDLMAANADFNTTVRTHLNAIIESFEARPRGSGENRRLGEILIEQNLATAAQVAAALGQQKRIGELLVADGTIKEEDLKKALAIQNQRALDAHLKECKSTERHKTIRIDQSKLDNFANSVGGLYINLDSVNFLRKQLEAHQVDFELISRFDTTVQSLEKQIEMLHENIMSIRRVPVKSLFQRFPKVVRQLSAALGKEIEFTLHGEETVIDKDLLEKIENPLVHVLRNSVDHGIELPEIRREQGKEPQGKLSVAARADENNVYIAIEDDGAGIDPEKMRQVAAKKGFMTDEELAALSDRELINLIFRPGFSSAEKVSDVSGRGVGMDVVLSGLKECNGEIEVDSVPSKGTTVHFTIPLTKTLVTMDAMIAACGEETYAIPSDDITTVIETETIIPLMAAGNCISHDDAILHLVEMKTFFYPRAAPALDNGSPKIIVVCKELGVGLVVDKILSHQKIVAKDFNHGYRRLRNIEGVRGYTIMGSEEIILIADVKRIAATFG